MTGLPLFAGDVLLTSDVSGITVDDGTDTLTIDLGQGSWFSSPLALVDYIVTEWNATSSNSMSWSFDTATGVITLSWLSGSMDFSWVSPLIREPLGAEDVTGSTSPFTFSASISPLWLPVWPVADYQRGIRSDDNSVTKTQDGTVYSVAGEVLHLRSLQVNIDRRIGFDDTTPWVALFEQRWQAGRSVRFWLDRTDYSDHTKSESLTLAGEEMLEMKRALREKDTVSTSGPFAFIIRPAHPDDAVYKVF